MYCHPAGPPREHVRPRGGIFGGPWSIINSITLQNILLANFFSLDLIQKREERLTSSKARGVFVFNEFLEIERHF
jgi:hypothetical protein